jgi:hypothetical protein
LHLLTLLPTLATLLALGGAPQRTPTPDETRLYDDGARALAAGDARAAEKAWKAGYQIAHDPAFLVHIGEAEEKAGAPAEAAETYRRYLSEAPDASDRAEIEQRVARLAPAATSAPAAAAHADAEKPAAATEEESGWNRYNATAVIAAGVTLVVLGTAAGYAAQASSKEGDINRLVTYRFPPPPYSSVAAEYTSAMSDGRSDAHVARILLLTAAGTAVVSAVFFVLDAVRAPAEAPAPPAAPPVSVSVAPDGRGGLGALGAWSWRF